MSPLPTCEGVPGGMRKQHEGSRVSGEGPNPVGSPAPRGTHDNLLVIGALQVTNCHLEAV